MEVCHKYGSQWPLGQCGELPILKKISQTPFAAVRMVALSIEVKKNAVADP